MTFKSVRAAAKAISPFITVRKTSDGEYRVSIDPLYFHVFHKMDYKASVEKNEAIAYYTDDASDAMATMVRMWANRSN